MIQSPALRIAAGSMWQVRTLPTFSERTRSHASSTSKCCITAGSDMAKGRASSLTEAGLRISRSTIFRRVGSASDWNTWSSRRDWLGTHLSICLAPPIVKHHVNYRCTGCDCPQIESDDVDQMTRRGKLQDVLAGRAAPFPPPSLVEAVPVDNVVDNPGPGSDARFLLRP